MIRPTRMKENRQNSLSATTSASRLVLGRAAMCLCSAGAMAMFFPPLRREVSRVVPSRHPPFGCSNKNEIIGLSFPGHPEVPRANLAFQFDAARSRNLTPRLQVCRSLFRRGKKWTSSCSSHCSCFCSRRCRRGRIAVRAGRGFMVLRPLGILELPARGSKETPPCDFRLDFVPHSSPCSL